MKIEIFAIDVGSTPGIEIAKIIEDDGNGFVGWPTSATSAEFKVQRVIDDDGEFVSAGLVLVPVYD